MRSTLNSSSPESGNVIFIILIAVILFGALSYVASTMMRGGESISEEKAALEVAELMSYTRAVKEAVHSVRIMNACEDEQISFERSPFDGSDPAYVNANAPADFSCHVFHPNGGGLVELDVSAKISDFPSYIFTGNFGVEGLGILLEPELAVLVRNLSETHCRIANERLGMEAPEADNFETLVIGFFTGTYVLGGGVGTSGSGHAMYDGKNAGCFYESHLTSGEYVYYHVFITR